MTGRDKGLPDIPVVVETVFGARTRQPLVRLVVGDSAALMPCEQAREIGTWLIHAAEGATTDGFMYEYGTKVLGMSDSSAAQFIQEFRRYREAQRVRETNAMRGPTEEAAS